MRRISLILTVLLVSAPAMATVTITVEQDASNERKVWIGYESDEAELIRAFALDIEVTDGNIIEVNDYAIGDDNGGYGIFPGSFAAAPVVVNPTTGQVDTWDVVGYSPVAPPGAPDSLGGLGTSGVTIEMGSLYDTAAPSSTSGILCSVTVDDNVWELCVTANALRGNVVLESGAEVVDLVLGDDGQPLCLDFQHCEVPLDQCEDWVAVGKPSCWMGAMAPGPWPGANPTWAYQCDGDADGLSET
ncbi:MAG: hypothetical protein ACYS8Z_16615, partial [Planctomycetota bacterium]